MAGAANSGTVLKAPTLTLGSLLASSESSVGPLRRAPLLLRRRPLPLRALDLRSSALVFRWSFASLDFSTRFNRVAKSWTSLRPISVHKRTRNRRHSTFSGKYVHGLLVITNAAIAAGNHEAPFYFDGLNNGGTQEIFNRLFTKL